MHNPLPQTVIFPQREVARFIKLEATTPDASTAVIETEEIGVSLGASQDDETNVYSDPVL